MIAIISDVHGNYEALKAVVNKIQELHIKEIYCLGDVVGYYSQVNECCDLLRSYNAKCVLGNHDWYMVSGTVCKRSKSVMDCLDFQKKIISEDNHRWLLSFPVIRNAYGISMVHGGWNNPIDEYLDPEEEYFSDLSGNLFASGHTHVQTIKKYQGKVYCNPGSVGQPRDGDCRAAFATFDEGEFYTHRVEYDYEIVMKKMDEAGFSPYYYGCLKDASSHLHA